MKRMYGVMEKQFENYMNQAFKSKGNTGEALFWLLERRLDNVVYRLGFAKSRPQARQLVTHRHILVNGKRVNIPSYQLSVGETVAIEPKSAEIPSIKKMLSDKEPVVSAWLKRKSGAGVVSRMAKRDDIKELINESDIIEFYSR